MKKAFLLSFVVLTVAMSIGCSNGLPRNCAMRKWFCGKECASAPTEQTVYYPADVPCTTCTTCPTCTTDVVVGEPVITETTCSSCSSCPSCNAPSLPAPPASNTGTGTTPAPSPAPYSYNN